MTERTVRRKSRAILRPMATRTPRGKGKTFAEEFGERLKAARDRRKLTQEEVAEAAGLGVSLDELVGLREGGVPGEVRDGRLRASILALDATAREPYIDAASLI